MAQHGSCTILCNGQRWAWAQPLVGVHHPIFGDGVIRSRLFDEVTVQFVRHAYRREAIPLVFLRPLVRREA